MNFWEITYQLFQKGGYGRRAHGKGWSTKRISAKYYKGDVDEGEKETSMTIIYETMGGSTGLYRPTREDITAKDWMEY